MAADPEAAALITTAHKLAVKIGAYAEIKRTGSNDGLEQRITLSRAVIVLVDQALERETRIQQLLRDYVRLTNEQPFPEELRDWPAQRAALIAEVGTLRARLAELESRV